MASTFGRPPVGSSIISRITRIHSSIRFTSPARSQPVSIEQKHATREREVGDLAGGDRSHRAVEAIEPLAKAALRDERDAGVGEGSHLEVVVAELEGDGERAVGAGLELVDVGSVAGHERELEVAPLDARTDSFERSPGPIEPAAAGGVVAQRTVVQLGERDRDASGRAQVTAIAVGAERGFGVSPARLQVVLHVRDPGEARLLVGIDVGVRRHPAIVGPAATVP